LTNIAHRLLGILALTAIYFAGGKLGLTLAFVHPSATAVWPSLGISVAALLIFGYKLWPGILLGAFLVNLSTAGTIATSITIALGNTLEAVTGAFLVSRFADGRNAMKSSANIFKFAFLAGIVSATIAATIGVWSLVWANIALPKDALSIWWTWWLGDAASVMVFAPVFLLWNTKSFIRWRVRTVLEAGGLFVSLVAVGLIVFSDVLTSGAQNYPLEFLCVPFLIWAATRFGMREAALATVVLSGPAIWGTLHGFGPFAGVGRNESLLLLQGFIGVSAVMAISLASEVSERRRTEREARILAGVDRLTGLGNYRKLIDTLELEIKRAQRTKRTFVVILMDLDGLKRINDIHGHQVGNQALCRLANVLKLHSRGIDTPARFGGDEFALVLPECGLEFARSIADRLSEHLANDGELPALRISIGYSVYPHSATSVDGLIREADRALYVMKHRHHSNYSLPTESA
jgi:diguanylate cyclase (GGDEF)-like protein